MAEAAAAITIGAEKRRGQEKGREGRKEGVKIRAETRTDGQTDRQTERTGCDYLPRGNRVP